MPSARIELSNGSGPCAHYGIDPTRPAILSAYFGDKEWDEFCDQIDETLRPINCASMSFCGCFGLAVVVFAAILAFVVIDFLNCEPLEQCGPAMGLFAVPVVFFFFAVVTLCVTLSMTFNTKSKLQEICQSISHRHPELSFHVQFERNLYPTSGRRGRLRMQPIQHIDVSIDDHEGGDGQHNRNDPIKDAAEGLKN